MINKLMTFCKASKLYLCYKALYRTTTYSVEQGRNQGDTWATVTNWRQFVNISLNSWAKRGVRVFDQWSHQSKRLATPLLWVFL